MDVEWAIDKLGLMVQAIDLHQVTPLRGGTHRDVLRHIEASNRILSHIGFAKLMPSADKTTMEANRQWVMRAIGYLQDKAELEQRLRPAAPLVSAGAMHPWVWGAAEQLWASGHHREAVEAAAKAVNGRVQQLIGRRDVSDNDLMNHALSPGDPRPGATKLQVPGDHTTGMVRGQQQALRDFAAGCFGVIRNEAAHDEDEWPEQVALERLAALSVLARAIEGTTPVTAPAADPT